MGGLWVLEDCLTGTTSETCGSRGIRPIESDWVEASVGWINSGKSTWFELLLGWTKSGKSSGGTTISESEIGGENSAETIGKLEEWSCTKGWRGKTEWEEVEGALTYLEIQDLKGKIDSLKTTSLDKKQDLVLRSYNLYPLTPCG